MSLFIIVVNNTLLYSYEEHTL